MTTFKQLKREFDKDVQELQKNCPHKKKSKWMDHWWAIGHSSGYSVKICLKCNEELEQSPTKEERAAEELKHLKEAFKGQPTVLKKLGAQVNRRYNL